MSSKVAGFDVSMFGPKHLEQAKALMRIALVQDAIAADMLGCSRAQATQLSVEAALKLLMLLKTNFVEDIKIAGLERPITKTEGGVQ